MIKRINFTGRRRILREDVRVYLRRRPGGPATFRAELDLSGYDLPADATVRIEAYRLTSWMSFELGTVGALDILGDHELLEFGDAEGVLFRVRVVSADPQKRVVLAEADQIHGIAHEEADDGREHILPVVGADLEAAIWQVSFDNGPALLVNRAIPDWQKAVKSPQFIALVYPAIVRIILTRAVKDDADPEDAVDPLAKWIRFAHTIPGVREYPDDHREREQWIDDVVSAFCRWQKLLDRFIYSWKSEAAS